MSVGGCVCVCVCVCVSVCFVCESVRMSIDELQDKVLAHLHERERNKTYSDIWIESKDRDTLRGR